MTTTPMSRRRKELALMGARSVFDMTGQRSYEAMRSQLPQTTPTHPSRLMVRAGRTLTTVQPPRSSR